jgi:hypothetical protein
VHTTTLNHWLRWGLANFLTLLTSASPVAKITGLSHCAQPVSTFFKNENAVDIFKKISKKVQRTFKKLPILTFRNNLLLIFGEHNSEYLLKYIKVYIDGRIEIVT